MGKKWQGLKKWAKTYKKQIFIVSVNGGVIVITTVLFKNAESIEEWLKLKKSPAKIPEKLPIEELVEVKEEAAIPEVISAAKEVTQRSSHEVSEHIRKLPAGWSASPSKIALAAEHGYSLEPGQTWVERYTTGKYIA